MEQLQPISRTYQYRKVITFNMSSATLTCIFTLRWNPLCLRKQVSDLACLFFVQVMKPMLERKRRARINRCLDELKDLMVTALQAEGENVSKLEKADILELTVNHLHRLRRQQRLAANPVTDADRFRAGFTHCATEVSRCLAGIPGVDVQLGTKLMTHLGHRLNEMDNMSPLTVQVASEPTPPGSPAHSVDSEMTDASAPSPDPVYTMPLTPASSRNSASPPANSPSDLEYTGNLLKVVDYSIPKKCVSPAVSTESMWRPW